MTGQRVCEQPLDAGAFRQVIGGFMSGVVVITATHQGERRGMTVSAVASLSLDPPMIVACLNAASSMQEVVRRAGAFAVNGRRSHAPAILESARWVLENLVIATRAGARLGVMTGTDVAYIEKRCDHSPVTTFAQTSRLPAHATALGMALLAFFSAEILNRVIGGGLKRYAPTR